MGWGLTINNIYLSRATKDGLQMEKEELTSLIDMYKNELVAIGAFTGEKYFDGDQDWSLVDHVTLRVPEIVNELCEASFRLTMVELALDNPEDVTGE